MKLSMYKFFYYKLYIWNYKRFGKSDLPELNGLITLSLLNIFNFITVLLLIDYFFKINIFTIITENKVFIIVSSSLILLANYVMLVFKGKHKIIVKQVEGLDKSQFKRNSYFAYFYVISSILSLVIAVCLEMV
jgi:hypothetical protein